MPPQVAQRVSPPAMATANTRNHNNPSPPVVPAAVPSNSAATATAEGEKLGAHGAKVKHKRRFCRIEGCERIVKSQGLCQRHGAKPRLCKVDGCEKQAQGNFDGMCKSHFKEHKRKTTPIPAMNGLPSSPPEPEGTSVYDAILPISVNFVPSETPAAAGAATTTMPLVAHLAEGFHGGKPPAWHRNEERRARGLLPIQNPATQLEGWERELVWMEILMLTGVPEVSFRHLARAWGRDKGFHMVLAQFICERHGDVQRKKRKRDDEYHEDEETAAAAAAAAGGGTRNGGLTVAARKKSPAAARQQQQQQPPPIIPNVPEQVPFMKRVSNEQMKEIRTALLTPEGKKQMVSLLRRRSSDRNSSGGSSTGSDGQSLIGVDIWDETFYSDSNYNEALAADLFNLTEEETSVLRRRLSVVGKTGDDDSSSAYSRSAASKHLPPSLPLTAALQKRDSGAFSNAGSEIPNTVKVEQAPDPEVDSLGPAFANEGNQIMQQQQQQRSDHFSPQQAPPLPQQPTPNQGYLQQDSAQAIQQNQGITQQEMQYVNSEEQNQFQDAEVSLDYRANDGQSHQHPAPNQHVPLQQQQQQQNFQQTGSHVQQQQQQQLQETYHNAMQVPHPQHPQHPVVHQQELAPKPDPQQQQYAHHDHQPVQQQQHQQQAQQGHPLHAQPNILPNENAQSLHQRQHSLQEFSLHGQLPAQVLHHRQHSLHNFHLHGQPQAPPVQHQQHSLVGQSHGQADHQGQALQSHPLQNASNQPYKHVHHGQPGSNATFHPGQPAHQISQAQIHHRQPVQLPRQPPHDDGDGLHDYDHHTEHLQAQDDEHLDPSHEHHDYGEEIEHEDHDHQDQGNAQQHAAQSQQVHHQAPGYQPTGGQPVHQQQPQNATEQPHNASFPGESFQGQQQQQSAYVLQQSVQQSYNSYQPPTQHGEASYEVPQQQGQIPLQHYGQSGQPPAENFEQQGQPVDQHFEQQGQPPVQNYEQEGQQPPMQQDAGTGQQDYSGYVGEQEALFELPYTTPATFQEDQNVDQQQPQDTTQQQQQQQQEPMFSEPQQQGYPQDPTQQQQSYQEQQHLQQDDHPQDHQNPLLPQGQQIDQQGTGNEFQYAEDSNYVVVGDQPNNNEAIGDMQYGNTNGNQGGVDGNGQHQGY